MHDEQMAHFLNPLLEKPSAPWRLWNVTRQSWVATELVTAFDSQSRRQGLLSVERLAPGCGLILAPTSAIHTFFMKFAIDVIFVARNGRVLKTVPSMAPQRLSAAWGAFAVVELPPRSLGLSGTSDGDILRPLCNGGPVTSSS
jgi:uncharacterized membrane protein (UPF0127 family)